MMNLITKLYSNYVRTYYPKGIPICSDLSRRSKAKTEGTTSDSVVKNYLLEGLNNGPAERKMGFHGNELRP